MDNQLPIKQNNKKKTKKRKLKENYYKEKRATAHKNMPKYKTK